MRTVVEFIAWERHNMKMPKDGGQDIPQHTRYKTPAAVIREIFHDAKDYNSLMWKSHLPGIVSPVDGSTSGEHGGVDGCLHVSLPDWRSGSWIHKKELNYPLDFVTLNQDKDALIARTAGTFAL